MKTDEFPYVITFDDGHNYPLRFTVKNSDDVYKVCKRYSEPGTEYEAYDALCIGSPDYTGEFVRFKMEMFADESEEGDTLTIWAWHRDRLVATFNDGQWEETKEET